MPWIHPKKALSLVKTGRLAVKVIQRHALHHGIMVIDCTMIIWLVVDGGWATPLKNMKVSCGYYSQYMEKIRNVPNQQPVIILRANPSACPRLRRWRLRRSKKTVFCGTKCTCPWSWLSSCNAQLSYLCVECYIIIIISSIIIIININNNNNINPKP